MGSSLKGGVVTLGLNAGLPVHYIHTDIHRILLFRKKLKRFTDEPVNTNIHSVTGAG